MYVGGAEHATGHVLYARFWHKFLKDYGLVPTDEPFQTWKNQGYILGTDGRKMSKRWGNVINPDEVVQTYGADTLRVYEMFMGPFDGTLPWSTENIIGSRRFIERVWKLGQKVIAAKSQKIPASAFATPEYQKFETILHKTIQKVATDISDFGFNTAVSSMMITLNAMESLPVLRATDFELFLKLLSPFAPHVTEEIWASLGHKTLLVSEKWPSPNAKKMKESQMRIVIQINGKVRADMLVDFGATEEAIVAAAQALSAVDKWITGQQIRKIIYIPGRVLNLVV